MQRPRLRDKSGREVNVLAYYRLRDDANIGTRVSDIMVAGVPTRRYEEMLPQAAATIAQALPVHDQHHREPQWHRATHDCRVTRYRDAGMALRWTAAGFFGSAEVAAARFKGEGSLDPQSCAESRYRASSR